jgi:hypothetical protein
MAIKIKVIDEENPQAENRTAKKTVKKKTASKEATKTVPAKSKKASAKKTVKKNSLVQKTEIIKEEIKDNLEKAEKIMGEGSPDKSEESESLKIKETNILDNPKLDPVKSLIKKESEIASGENNENTEEELIKPEQSKRSIKLYKNIAYFFIFLVVILLGSLSYFSFKQVEIVLIPNQERKSSNLIFDIYDETSDPGDNTSIKGIVREIKVDASDTYETSGSEVIGKEVVGEVTIYNNYTQNQPLVATTRLLTPDSKLFRIAETVNVPAGGSVEVQIYADNPDPDLAVGPTKFSIPGLWAGLQEKIFAESTEDTVYRQKVKKYVIEADFDEAKKV